MDHPLTDAFRDIWLLAGRTTRRKRRLVVDGVLSRVEGRWVRLRGGWIGRERGRNTDPATGRTSVEALEATRLGPRFDARETDALAKGVTRAELDALVDDLTDQFAPKIVATLDRYAPSMLREHRAMQRGFRRRTRAVWGDALDEMYAVYVAAEEIGSDTQALADVADPGRRVQLALHARTCLVLAEVHCLLSNGWVFGAMGRARTAHEAAVVSSVLATAESETPELELAQRFDDHKVFDLLRDLKRARDEGEDIPDELLVDVEADAAVIAARYEKGFNKTNGWARPLFPGLSPGSWVKFDQLEELAEASFSRLDYRISSHHVHSSARSLDLDVVERQGKQWRVTGPVNAFLADPAQMALRCVAVTTSGIVYGSRERPDPSEVLPSKVIDILCARAIERFDEASGVLAMREAGIS